VTITFSDQRSIHLFRKKKILLASMKSLHVCEEVEKWINSYPCHRLKVLVKANYKGLILGETAQPFFSLAWQQAIDERKSIFLNIVY